jgi:hypothetical protein
VNVYLYLDSNNRVTGWSSSQEVNTTLVQLNADDPFFNAPFTYTYTNGTLTKDDAYHLAAVKTKKINELDSACSTAILGEFTAVVNGTTYSFAHDVNAQTNFTSAKLAFIDGSTTTITWTAYDSNGNVVRLQLTADLFNTVFTAKLEHTTNNISRFRDTLAPQVNAATTVDAVNAITW